MNETKRCAWVTTDPLYLAYHDAEWGVPVHDDGRLFEFLVLETFQAGLSWLTVLRKRENFRQAFDHFKVETVASYGEKKMAELLNNPGIIRNKLKVQAAVSNAQAFLNVQEEFGSFDSYSWSFVGGKPLLNHWRSLKEVPSSSRESDAFSKDLKKRGFKFVGSTVVYAHMQATGMVMDHTTDCFRYSVLSQT
jgi:DNA-3-methyladenine glycosylase I